MCYRDVYIFKSCGHIQSMEPLEPCKKQALDRKYCEEVETYERFIDDPLFEAKVNKEIRDRRMPCEGENIHQRRSEHNAEGPKCVTCAREEAGEALEMPRDEVQRRQEALDRRIAELRLHDQMRQTQYEMQRRLGGVQQQQEEERREDEEQHQDEKRRKEEQQRKEDERGKTVAQAMGDDVTCVVIDD